MDEASFVSKYPRLWHMADDSAWPSLCDHGLRSTEWLVRRSTLTDSQQDDFLSSRRETSQTLVVDDLGEVVIRDHGPLNLIKLERALTNGMTVAEWIRLLNGHVFLFPQRDSLDRLSEKYGSDPVIVVEIATRSLMQEYGSLVRVAGMNTGSTAYAARPRGRETFQSVRAFDQKRQVKEVVVERGIPDLATHLINVQRWLPTSERITLPL